MLSEKVGGPDMAPHTPPTLVSAPGNPGRYSMTGQCVVAGAPPHPPGQPGALLDDGSVRGGGRPSHRPEEPGALLDDGSVRGGAVAEYRGGDAVDHDVDDGRLAGGDGALEGSGQIGRALDVLAVAAERLGDPVVARRQQRAGDRALGAVVPDLELVLGVPARVVADHGHERQ